LAEFDSYFYRSFSRLHYVYELCSALDVTSKAIVVGGVTEDVLRLLMTLVVMVGAGGPADMSLYNAKHTQEVLSAGFLGLLCRVTTSLPADDDLHNGAGSVLLRMVGKYTTYTGVLDELRRVEFPASLDPILLEKVTAWGGPFSMSWELFCAVVSERMKLPRDIAETFMLCDNPSVSLV
jgi:hypothetical protein